MNVDSRPRYRAIALGIVLLVTVLAYSNGMRGKLLDDDF